jgi:anti-sigma regulatory factor (Ser/Thr protein kinase)
LNLHGKPIDVAAARGFIMHFLGLPAANGHVHSAVGVISELVTNAVTHGRGPITVEARLEGECVYLAVADCSEAIPQQRVQDVSAEDGRGIAIVDSLAESWGVEHTVNGKRVWASVPLI